MLPPEQPESPIGAPSARFARQVVLPEIGPAGQRRLAAARVLVVGAGGLGSASVLYLAAAGVGTIGLVDDDVVDLSNLHRQLLHDTSSVGMRKVESAMRRLGALDPRVVVEPHAVRLDPGNARALVGRYDLVVDGSDNFATRYAVSDACVGTGRVNVHASVTRFTGQVTVLSSDAGPCYRCLFPEPPAPGLVPGCAEAGVLGAAVGVVGTIQAAEALKVLLGIGRPLSGRLLLVDVLPMRFTEFAVERDPACVACGQRERVERPREVSTFAEDITPRELRDRLGADGEVVVADVRSLQEWERARIPGARHVDAPDAARALAPERERAIVVYCQHGVRSVAVASALRAAGFRDVRSLRGGYARWIGEGGTDP